MTKVEQQVHTVWQTVNSHQLIPQVYTLEQVAQHTDPDKGTGVWLVIDNQVYDVWV